MRLSVALIVLFAFCAACGAARPNPEPVTFEPGIVRVYLPHKPPSHLFRPRTDMEERVTHFFYGLHAYEQGVSLRHAEVDRQFLVLVGEAFQSDLRGEPCGWLLGYARALNERVVEVYYPPDYLTPDERSYLESLAAMPIEEHCMPDRPPGQHGLGTSLD